MKKAFVLFVAIAAFTTACEKEDIKPQTQNVVATAPVEKAESGRKINTCHLRDGNGEVLAEGQTCKEAGGTCGRKPRCTAKLGAFPDIVVFEHMTQRQVVELWNTDEGMEFLMSKGVYAVDDL
jgi:hypothetical protein